MPTLRRTVTKDAPVQLGRDEDMPAMGIVSFLPESSGGIRILDTEGPIFDESEPPVEIDPTAQQVRTDGIGGRCAPVRIEKGGDQLQLQEQVNGRRLDYFWAILDDPNGTDIELGIVF